MYVLARRNVAIKVFKFVRMNEFMYVFIYICMFSSMKDIFICSYIQYVCSQCMYVYIMFECVCMQASHTTAPRRSCGARTLASEYGSPSAR